MMNQNCPICYSSKVSHYLHLKSNNLIAKKCKECGHVFIENSPISSDNISDYYTMDDFKGQRQLQNDKWYTDYYADCFSTYEQKLNSSLVLKQFQEKADYFDSEFPQHGRLLDIGCATGVFLDIMQKRGWDVEGVEISDELASYARKTFSLHVHVKDLTREKITCKPFHVITLFDVIEHLPDPHLMISACKSLLTENGILMIRTPTEEGFLRDIAKILYRMTLRRVESPMLWFYSFEHLHSFSLNTLNMMLEKHKIFVSRVFHEEESLERISIPMYMKIMMNGINVISSLLNKAHKITVVGKRVQN